MSVFTKNLIDNVLIKPSVNNTHLTILTGYSSASFLEEIIQKLPNISITLILGMTPHGISSENLEGYRRLSKSSEKIEVLIQVEKPVTHMKIYQWFDNELPNECFIGSANFSYSGFHYQNEVMNSTSECVRIIDGIRPLCWDCKDRSLEKKIRVYHDEEELLNNSLEEEIKNQERSSNIESYGTNRLNRKTSLYHYTKNLESNETLVELSLNGVLNKGLKKKKNSYLDIDKNSKFFNKFFDEEEQKTLLTDDGFRFSVKRQGDFNRELVITDEDWNFKKYLCHRLKLDNNEQIKYADLTSNSVIGFKIRIENENMTLQVV